MFIEVLLTIAKRWKQSKYPSVHQQTIDLRGCGVYIYIMEYYSAIEKNELLPFAAAQMDLENIKLSEMSDRERQILCDITYMWNLKIKLNLYIKQKQTHRHRKQTYGY